MSAEAVAERFLRYMYGADDADITKICWPHEDLWMLPGAKDTNAWQIVGNLKLDPKQQNGIISGVIPRRNANDLYVVELRDGKVDPAMNLDGVYLLHRRAVMMFLYAALIRDNEQLSKITTDARNLNIIGKKAARGDMDVYEEVITAMPVVRQSKPADDAKSRNVSYRIPLSDTPLVLTLIKQGSTWKIDTSKKVNVPLEFFFREN